MAGSYNHCVNDDGELLSNDDFVDMIENLGDAYEAVEEMYAMIWLLANGDRRTVETARKLAVSGHRSDPGVAYA